MKNILINRGKFINFGLLLLRISVGFLMILHGLPKMAGGEETWKQIGSAVEHIGISGGHVYFGMFAGIIEVVAGLMLIFGLYHSIAALLLALVMLVAIFYKLNTTEGYIPVAHPLKMFFVFIGLGITGPGSYSIDHKFLINIYDKGNTNT